MHLIRSYTLSWIYKWAQFLLGLHEAYQILIHSFLVTFNQSKQSTRSIFRVISAQVYFTGVQALPFIIFLSSVLSFAFMFQAKFQMTFLGKTDLPAFLFVNVLFRELSVIVPAILLVARSGSAIASELASMVVNREVAALRVMGIHPYSFIVFPRIIGGFISLLGLAIYFNLIAVFVSGLSVNLLLDMDFSHFLPLIFDRLSFLDIFIFFLKVVVSSFIIFTVCSSKGLKVKSSAHEVPQATMSAVVSSLVYIIGFHLIFTLSFYLIQYVGLFS